MPTSIEAGDGVRPRSRGAHAVNWGYYLFHMGSCVAVTQLTPGDGEMAMCPCRNSLTRRLRAWLSIVRVQWSSRHARRRRGARARAGAMRDRALDLRARGFSVIPLIFGDKKPAVRWEWYQGHHASVETVAAWFRSPRNIGIVTGAISGVVVVDVDSDEAGQWAETHLPHTPMRTKTAKGEHWFYRHPGVPVPNRAHVGDMGLDVRGDGGYVVGPGSLHPSGVVYEAVGEWPGVDALPLFDVRWLAEVRLVYTCPPA